MHGANGQKGSESFVFRFASNQHALKKFWNEGVFGNMKNGKKLCLLLSCVVLMTLLCAFAAAESADSGFEITGGVLTKYTGPGGDVVIPDGVTEIGEEAFYWCSDAELIVGEGSCAEQYAQENEIPYSCAQ